MTGPGSLYVPTRPVTSTSNPVSSLTSRTTEPTSDSPISIPPPGSAKFPESARGCNNTRPWRSATTADVATTRELGSGAAASFRNSWRDTRSLVLRRARQPPDVLKALGVTVEQAALASAAQMQHRGGVGVDPEPVRIHDHAVIANIDRVVQRRAVLVKVNARHSGQRRVVHERVPAARLNAVPVLLLSAPLGHRVRVRITQHDPYPAASLSPGPQQPVKIGPQLIDEHRRIHQDAHVQL